MRCSGSQRAALNLWDEVFVADLGGVAVGFDVVVVLAGALDVHVAGVPVAVLDAGLRAPVGPDAELGVVEPGGEAIGLQRGWRSGEGAGRDCDLILLREADLRAGAAVARRAMAWRRVIRMVESGSPVEDRFTGPM